MLMELFSQIRQEHKELLNDVDRLVGANPAQHRRSVDDLTIRLLAHWNAEEQSIYQAFEELDAVPRSLALRHEQEHHVMRLLMTELQEKVYNVEVWNAKLQVFRSVAQNHVDSEERTMFDMAGEYFNDEEINEMTRKFEDVEVDLFKESRIRPYTRKQIRQP